MDETITTVVALTAAAAFGYVLGWRRGVENRATEMQKLEAEYT